jgi:hypothetical protein
MKVSCRDDFPESVKRAIALRVNNRCSNIACGASTCGPQSEPGKILNIGVAAHITAASPGGPRYDSNLSADDRTSAANGIWLCQNCAKLVDNDPQRFPTPTLLCWKNSAEAYALERIGRQSPFEKSFAPELRVLMDEVGRMATRPLRAELQDEEIVEQLRKSLPADIGIFEEIKLLDRGRGRAGQPYAILAAGKNHGWDWEIVFFTAGEFGWEVIARTSLISQKGYAPLALYVPGTPGGLAITHVAGYGTGVFRRSTSWYRIAKGEPVPLLSYPLEFYVVGCGMPFDRKLSSKLLTMPASLQTGMALELDFMIEYTMGRQVETGPENLLFSTEQRLALEWNEEAGTFVPRTSNDDLGKIDELWSDSTEGFVKRNLSTLQHLAEHGTSWQRQFVQRHLLPLPSIANGQPEKSRG